MEDLVTAVSDSLGAGRECDTLRSWVHSRLASTESETGVKVACEFYMAMGQWLWLDLWWYCLCFLDSCGFWFDLLIYLAFCFSYVVQFVIFHHFLKSMLSSLRTCEGRSHSAFQIWKTPTRSHSLEPCGFPKFNGKIETKECVWERIFLWVGSLFLSLPKHLFSSK